MVQFLNELSKYPKIRDKSYISSPNSEQLVKTKKRKQNQLNAVPINVPVVDFDQNKSNFWQQLKQFLLKYYEKEETEKILLQFEKTHKAYLNSLSLDNVERLATKMAELRYME